MSDASDVIEIRSYRYIDDSEFSWRCEWCYRNTRVTIGIDISMHVNKNKATRKLLRL